MCKPHFGNQDFSQLANTVIINHFVMWISNPITNPNYEMGVAHAFEHNLEIIRIIHWFDITSWLFYSSGPLTRKSVSEALIFESFNPQYDERLSIESPEKYKFKTKKNIFLQNMF